MRSDTDRGALDALIGALARRVRAPHALYLVGGASAVIEGFRASPLDFRPELPGWRERSPHITHAGAIEVRHMDFRLQALAKLERGSEQDLADVSQMLDRGLVDRPGLAAAFTQMRSGLFRFPGVDEPTFARRVAEHTQDS